ncbi:MAG: GNAT family N-acetyltransferase [Pseudomonadota bacterium]
MIATTDRLDIDVLTRKDAPFLLSLMTSPPCLRFIEDRGLRSVEDAERYLAARYLSAYARYGFGYYIALTRIDDTPIGICGFLKRPELAHPDFGFALMPDVFGAGYAFELGRAVLEFARSRLDLDVVDALTAKDNAGSVRLLEKLGFELICNIPTETDRAPDLLFRLSLDRQ